MIAPLVKYTIKGALWYQGETEAGRAQGDIYGDAMMTLVQDWRRAFGQGDFPFYWVQLANYGNAAKNGHWMRVQEGQVKATALRNTGVAVITDIGNPTNIHPTNKQDVGRRLALLAENKGASPLYRQFTARASAIAIWFDHAGKGLENPRRWSGDRFSNRRRRRQVRPGDREDRGRDRSGLQPGRAKSAVGPLRVGLQPGREPDERPVGLPASLFRTDENDERVGEGGGPKRGAPARARRGASSGLTRNRPAPESSSHHHEPLPVLRDVVVGDGDIPRRTRIPVKTAVSARELKLVADWRDGDGHHAIANPIEDLLAVRVPRRLRSSARSTPAIAVQRPRNGRT